MSEQYSAWNPVDGIPHRLFLEALHDDYEGLRFLLRGEDKSGPMLRVLFDSAIGYRNVNESYRVRTWNAMDDMNGLPTLLTVKFSNWLAWLLAESENVLSPESLVHYAIYTPEDCIDVASEFPPVVDWLPE